MSRGRHRFSSPIRGLLPPVTFGTVAVGCAGAAWLVSDSEPQVMRWLVAGAAASAVAAAVLMRFWDRVSSLQVAEATGARARAERVGEERVGELKSDLEDARRIRVELEKQLGARHVDLARLRTDHAALLARYATAEADRADALEDRRQLAIESSAPAKALPPAGRTKRAVDPPSPSTYLRANAALDRLADSADRQGWGQSHTQAPPGDAATPHRGEGFSYFVRPKRRPLARGGGQAAGDERREDLDADDPGDAGTDLADVVGPEVLAQAHSVGDDEVGGEEDVPEEDVAEEDAAGGGPGDGGSGGGPEQPGRRGVDLEKAS